MATFHGDFDGLGCHLQNIDSSLKETHLIIKSQGELEKLLSCSEGLPEIDFENHFVLKGV